MTVAHSSSRVMQQMRKALFVPRPRCLSTGVKGFSQLEHIHQLFSQLVLSLSSQAQLSERLNVSCSASLGNNSFYLKDLITPLPAPQKASKVHMSFSSI